MEGEKRRRFSTDLSFDKRLLFLFAFIILIISASGSMDLNPLDPFFLITGKSSLGSQAPTMGTSVPMPAQYQTFAGQLDIHVQHRDALNFSEDRKEGTELSTTYYRQLSDGQFVTLGSGESSGISVTDSDRSLFFTVTPMNGSELYIIPNSMARSELNPRIVGFDYQDITMDGKGEWIFEFDILGLQVRPYSNPSLTFFTTSLDEGKMAMNSPSDIEVNSGSSIINIKWELMVPQEQGVAINRVQLIFDNVDSSLLIPNSSWVKIPYVDNLELPEMDKTMLSSRIVYNYDIGSSLGQAGYVTTEQDADTFHDMTVRLHTNLEEGDEYGVTLKVSALTPDMKIYTVSDTVKLISVDQRIPTTNDILDLVEDMGKDELGKIVWTPTLDCDEDSCETSYNVNYTIHLNNTGQGDQ